MTPDVPDRQAQLVRLLLVILGVALAVFAWWRFLSW
jgi:hypothetical protein